MVNPKRGLLHAPVLLDIHGVALSEVDRARLMHPLCAGVILFSRNWVSRTQLTHLCAEIKHLREDLIICVDHEGGRVQRFKRDGFTHLAPMASLGQAWSARTEGADPSQAALAAMQKATCMGYVMASELKACGVDYSFAPVLDLDHAKSAVIGDRAFHAHSGVVSVLAKSFMHGMLQAGMANCGKHFPGHGWAKADSHTHMPTDTRGLKAMRLEDLMPYAALSSSLDAIMPAHVVYPRVDALPAGFSRKWLQDILREELSFTGAIISDDLSMQGARVVQGRELGFSQAAVMALNAGCDLLLLCNQSVLKPDGANNDTLDVFLHELLQAHDQGEWHTQALSEHRRLNLLGQSRGLDWEGLMREPLYHQALHQSTAL